MVRKIGPARVIENRPIVILCRILQNMSRSVAFRCYFSDLCRLKVGLCTLYMGIGPILEVGYSVEDFAV